MNDCLNKLAVYLFDVRVIVRIEIRLYLVSIREVIVNVLKLERAV